MTSLVRLVLGHPEFTETFADAIRDSFACGCEACRDTALNILTEQTEEITTVYFLVKRRTSLPLLQLFVETNKIDLNVVNDRGQLLLSVLCVVTDGAHAVALFELLDRLGADFTKVTSEGNALFQYCKNCDEIEPVIVQELVARGNDINWRGPRNNTPLMILAQKGEVANMLKLVAAGADINAQNDNGATALMMLLIASIAPGDVKETTDRIEFHVKVRQLSTEDLIALARDADLSLRDNDEWTLLHCAIVLCAIGQFDFVAYLVDRGMDPHAKDKNGKTPYDFLSDQAKAMLRHRLAVCKLPRIPLTEEGRNPERWPAYLRDEVSCPVCLHVMNCPCIDEYGHVFCADCLLTALETKKVSPVTGDAYVQEFRHLRALHAIIENYAKEQNL